MRGQVSAAAPFASSFEAQSSGCTVQRMAAEIDARGHIPGRVGFQRLADGRKGGSITQAFKIRNEKFVTGPALGYATTGVDGRLDEFLKTPKL